MSGIPPNRVVSIFSRHPRLKQPGQPPNTQEPFYIYSAGQGKVTVIDRNSKPMRRMLLTLKAADKLGDVLLYAAAGTIGWCLGGPVGLGLALLGGRAAIRHQERRIAGYNHKDAQALVRTLNDPAAVVRDERTE